MAFTNRHNLPIEICNALTKNRYSGAEVAKQPNSISVTTLIAPIQQTILKQHYPDCGEGDVIDNLWSMFGSIAHTLLEEHGAEDANIEERYYAEVGAKTITGGIDHYKDGQITDYKVTSVWKVAKQNYTEWELQLNCYAWLLRRNNKPVNSIRIITIMRDWNEPDGYKPDYPEAPIKVIPIRLWSDDSIDAYIKTRVRAILYNETLEDDALCPCTLEEMWASPSRWAIMKEGNTKATKVFDDELEAINYRASHKDSLLMTVIERRGERRRCKKYCMAASHCVQWKRFQEEEGLIGNEPEEGLVF